MPHALNLRLDDASATAIERIHDQLARLHVSESDMITQYGSCVTVLVVTDVFSPETLARILRLRLPELDALAITLGAPCVIPGSPATLGLRVEASASLLRFHYEIFREFVEDDIHLHYRPAYWQPHLKLCSVRGDRLGTDRLRAAVAADWAPRGAMLDSLEIVRYPPIQAVWRARLQPPSGARPTKMG